MIIPPKLAALGPSPLRFAVVICIWLFLPQIPLASASEVPEGEDGLFDNNVRVATQQEGGRISINASFRLPYSACEAYAFMTDYEKNLKAEPEIVEASVNRLAVDQVLIQRRVREFVLFFPVHVNMVVQYTELPNQGLDFKKAGGDMKEYFGTWRVRQEASQSRILYDARINLDSLVPNFIIEHLIAMRLRDKFERLAQRASQLRYENSSLCLTANP